MALSSFDHFLVPQKLFSDLLALSDAEEGHNEHCHVQDKYGQKGKLASWELALPIVDQEVDFEEEKG